MRTYWYDARRRGTVIVLVAVVLVALTAMLALAVDIGYLYVVRADLQKAADAAALAGASGLSVGQDEAFRRAREYAAKNYADGNPVALEPLDMQLGLWDPETREFTPVEASPGARVNAMRVVPRLNEDRGNAVALFFANVLGIHSADVSVSAMAVFGPRDIVVTLDYSASMSYDSQIRHIPNLGDDGRQEVERSLSRIWQALGSPRYGNMPVPPAPLVYVASTSDSVIMNTLGLNSVPYPYPQSAYMDSSYHVRSCTRGWSDYFDYVQGQSNARNDNKTITDSRYRNRYGLLTLIDYFQAVQYRDDPDGIALWKTTGTAPAREGEEPMTAIKDAVSLFLDYLEEVPTNDYVALAVYAYRDGKACLEEELTDQLNRIRTTSSERQAGHYHNQTNIAAGIATARKELQTRGRSGAAPLIVLLSDGRANWTDDNTPNEQGARTAALNQARHAARDKIPILTISLGADADLDLMQQIADITGGIHFVVPGGSDVGDYRDQLFEVFMKVAIRRPLKLVD